MSPRGFSSFTTEQKVAFVLFLVIGVLGIALSVRSFSASLRRPFEQQLASYSGERYQRADVRRSAELEAQKQRDTDEDGLSDYDESAVYKTSPYLKDSDSDGMDDQTELTAGQDPNCPEGKQCGGAITADTAPSTTAEAEGLLGPTSDVKKPSESEFTFDSVSDIQAFLTSLGAEEIRSLLRAQGISEDVLSKLTDEELLAQFQKAAADAEANGSLEAVVEQEP